MTPAEANIQALALRAQQMQAGLDASASEPVLSPCISVCRMTPDRRHCEGCFRTLDEIRAWSQADGAMRLAIWRNLLPRAGIPVPQPQERCP